MHKPLRLQFPVGFGGFHLALLAAHSPTPFVIGYDCGSLQSAHASSWARRATAKLFRGALSGGDGRGDGGGGDGQGNGWGDGKPSQACSSAARIDVLFLSHTDFDHVCGLQSLLTGTTLETLVLPAQTLHFRAAQLARYSVSGVPAWYRAFAHSPTEWALKAGVRRVVEITASDDTKPGRDSSDSPPDGAPSTTLSFGKNTRASVADSRIFLAPSNQSWTVTVDTQTWNITPILAPPRDPNTLKSALRKALRHASLDALAADFSARKRHSLRNRLSSVYRKHWGSTNRSSIMMLVTPAILSQRRGWLCTGDADLTSTEVRAELEKNLQLLAGVDAVAVPHHGSPKNLDDVAATWLATKIGGNLKWVISKGKNPWGYPHKSVVAACKRVGCVLEAKASSDWSDVVRF